MIWERKLLDLERSGSLFQKMSDLQIFLAEKARKMLLICKKGIVVSTITLISVLTARHLIKEDVKAGLTVDKVDCRVFKIVLHFVFGGPLTLMAHLLFTFPGNID